MADVEAGSQPDPQPVGNGEAADVQAQGQGRSVPPHGFEFQYVSTHHHRHHQDEGEEEYCDHRHHSNRAPWLRALVLGANDGLVSIAALLMGVGAGTSDLSLLRLSGVSGLLSGALSMAVGEYVSVSSQRDAEKADIHQEMLEQLKGPEAQARELDELTDIYSEYPYTYEYQITGASHSLFSGSVPRATALSGNAALLAIVAL